MFLAVELHVGARVLADEHAVTGLDRHRLELAVLEDQEQKRGSIIIPDTAKEKPQEAKVIAVGTGKVTDDGKRLGLDVKVGDKILFGKYSGSEVQVDGKDYLIMREEDILGVIE